MAERVSFDYAIVRVAPRVERGELMNVGVILYCLAKDYLDAVIALDEARLAAWWPCAEPPDWETLRAHLAAIPRLCAGDPEAGPVARLTQRERWHWLVAPRSTILQTSPVHSGLCDDPRAALEALVASLVRRGG